MTNQGDFLKDQKDKTLLQQKQVRRVKLISFSILIVYCLLAGLVFSSLFYFQKEDVKIKKQQENKKAVIIGLKKIESLEIILEQRLSFLNKQFLEKRPPWLKLLTFFDGNLVEGIKLKEIEITETGETTIDGMASDALSLGRFLENMTSDDKTTLFSKVTLSSVTRQNDGTYFFNLALTANGESEKL